MLKPLMLTGLLGLVNYLMFRPIKPDVLDRLANHPDVHPFVSIGNQPIDHAPCFEPEHAALCRLYHNGIDDDDPLASIAVSFGWSSPNVWEMHVMVLKSARGKEALEFTLKCIADMFYQQGAKEIWGRPKVSNKVVRYFVRKVGAISRGFTRDPMFGEVELFATSKAEWEAWRNASTN